MKIIKLLFISLFPVSVLAQGTLIGSTIRNGSFESGMVSPWNGLTSVSNNASFSSQGDWFGFVQVVHSDPFGSLVRHYVSQSLPATRSDGLHFTLGFDARTTAAGFDRVEASLAGFNTNGSGISAAISQTTWPTLPNSNWGSYLAEFQMPSSWDGGGNLLLQISFWKSPSVFNTTYIGYLDNIVLQQIPEPSSVALLGLSGLFLFASIIRKQRPKHALL